MTPEGLVRLGMRFAILRKILRRRRRVGGFYLHFVRLFQAYLRTRRMIARYYR